MKDIILYHGSRGGIEGPIKPVSRPRCDFASGFYMGENPEQVKGLVVEDSSPVFYTMRFKLSEIPEDRILVLSNMEWLYTVLACRNKIPEFSNLDISKNAKRALQSYDVIVGPIGDDKMNEAMQSFANGSLTDKGLLACLQHVKYGLQYVARTDFACNKIEIITERDIFGKEADDIRKYTQIKRSESRDIVKLMMRKYRRNGLYIDELIDSEPSLAKDKEDLQEHDL